MTPRGYEKRMAKEMCRTLKDGLGFSCKIVLMKRTVFSPRGKKYVLRTNAPENIIQDILVLIL
jgi:hypothetical protein